MRTTSGSRYLNSLIWVLLAVSFFTKLQPSYFFSWFNYNFNFLDVIFSVFSSHRYHYKWIISSLLKGIICLTCMYFYVAFNVAGSGCSRGSEGSWMAQGELQGRVYQAMSLMLLSQGSLNVRKMAGVAVGNFVSDIGPCQPTNPMKSLAHSRPVTSAVIKNLFRYSIRMKYTIFCM